ncbi:MAG TPA: metal-dependent transcriptional regulator [Longimicrobiales bacterium]|nr:metal-dependent transcriptional regulator [Longimicrobiales bacterium]
MTTPAVEDYLKAIYQLSEAGEPVSTSSIAERLSVAPGSVTGMLKRLSEAGLVEHTRYYGARLTERGAENAVRTIRRHRVLELFLVDVLGYTWDRVHDEAERLEHVVTDELIDRMAHVLGSPTADPHGAPIPETGAEFREERYPCLAEMRPGEQAILRQVPDEDAAALRYLGELGLKPGVELEVTEVAPFNGPIHVLINGRKQVLGQDIARHVQVEPRG